MNIAKIKVIRTYEGDYLTVENVNEVLQDKAALKIDETNILFVVDKMKKNVKLYANNIIIPLINGIYKIEVDTDDIIPSINILNASVIENNRLVIKEPNQEDEEDWEDNIIVVDNDILFDLKAHIGKYRYLPLDGTMRDMVKFSNADKTIVMSYCTSEMIIENGRETVCIRFGRKQDIYLFKFEDKAFVNLFINNIGDFMNALMGKGIVRIENKTPKMIEIEREFGKDLEDILRELYVDKHLKKDDLANYLGITEVTLGEWLEKANIKSRRLYTQQELIDNGYNITM